MLSTGVKKMLAFGVSSILTLSCIGACSTAKLPSADDEYDEGYGEMEDYSDENEDDESVGTIGYAPDGSQYLLINPEDKPKVSADAERTSTYHMGTKRKSKKSSSTTQSSSAASSDSSTSSSSSATISPSTDTGSSQQTTSSLAAAAAGSAEAGTVYGQRSDSSSTASSSESDSSSSSQATEALSKTVCIDPGHQFTPNSEQEPVAPGSMDTKDKATKGSMGVVSGLAEYELTLIIAQKVEKKLKEKGYDVIMTRNTNEANISNVERAEMANNANVGAFVRIHADGSDNPNDHGAMAICQTASNSNNGDKHVQSLDLATKVLDGVVAATGCDRERVWETDSLITINWAKVPVTVIEVGYMTNAQDDAKMATDEYREKIADGIVNGIDNYYASQANAANISSGGSSSSSSDQTSTGGSTYVPTYGIH